MKTNGEIIRTNDGRGQFIVDGKRIGNVNLYLVRDNLLPEALIYAGWGMVAERNGTTRYVGHVNESGARADFARR